MVHETIIGFVQRRRYGPLTLEILPPRGHLDSVNKPWNSDLLYFPLMYRATYHTTSSLHCGVIAQSPNKENHEQA